MLFKDIMLNHIKKHKNDSKILIMFGVPGVGKGTFASLLEKDLNFYRSAPGDLLRKYTSDSKLSRQPRIKIIINNIQQNKLIDNDLISELTLEEFELASQQKHYNGIIFDGFPRNMEQGCFLQNYFTMEKLLAINIKIDHEILLKRTLGRKICPQCQTTYNAQEIHEKGYEIEPILPKIFNVCDECGINLTQRVDDRADYILQRIKTYQRETDPIQEYFKNINIPFIDFEPKRGIKDYEQLKQMIKDSSLFNQLISVTCFQD